MWNWDTEQGHAKKAACSDGEDFLKHILAVNDENFVACVDIGHAEMKGLNTSAESMIRTLGSHVAALHIHDNDKLFVLPDSVSDDEALFIGDVSLALSVIDSLGIKKGDYITIIGANNFAVILSQLLIYYQAVPIIVGIDEEQNRIARDSGIYYVLGPNDNWTKEVNAITGGRMTTSVVYISDNNISVNKAFALASHGANVAFTGISNKTGAIAFTQAIKKRLTIHCIAKIGRAHV